MNSRGKGRIAVALSGGVDSSIAAALLQQQGYEVVGLTLSMRHPDPEFSERQSCGVKNDLDAIAVLVDKLKIEHHFLARYAEFEERVLKPSWRDYANGRTPNPCCRCNYLVKFGELIKAAQDLGASALATGHYARLVQLAGHQRILRGVDRGKDQSYFLYHLTTEQVDFLRFPVGDLEKTVVKQMAADLGLKILAEKKESQDACFSAEKECFSETLRRLFNVSPADGVFIYNGKVVGKHHGIHQFTLGQRKGLNVALGVPAYVKRIEAATGVVELTTDEAELEVTTFRAADLNWQGTANMTAEKFKADIQVRYRSPSSGGEVQILSGNTAQITLEKPVRAVSPGQAAVFYDGEMLLGGGTIL